MNSAAGFNVKSTRDARRGRQLGTVALLCIVVVGLCLVVLLQRRLDSLRPPASAEREIEELYVSGEAAKRASLAFSGLVADWYWMRGLQYTGRKMLNHTGAVQLDDLSPLGMKMLAPLLDRATTLDPKYMTVYEYGAVVLPAVDATAAERLLRKGIEHNPGVWRLYHHLGYIYWQQNRFREARETYEAGAKLPGAPAWMRAMAPRMEAEGGSRATAREMYARIHADADDEQIRNLAAGRLLWLQSLDERDMLRNVIVTFRGERGTCPKDFSEVRQQTRRAGFKLDVQGAPLDPSGTPYNFDAAACEVRLDPRSKVPYN